MSTVIKVENLSKQYRLGQVGTGTISHDVNRWWHKIRGKEDPYLKIGESNDRTTKGDSDYVWALKDINFEVQQGEVLGIIGRNGAGKSTLLKILSRTTSPTTGSVKIKGRVASLLEVGTGFHPELSGRDNIFLNGAILGMTRREIQSKFDEIVDFAGVERYIDTPVKRYSSGMYVRLAFAVAAHLEPEILIVDEVLAVGDAEFQKRCLGKMKDVSVNQGRTVLFVSHQMDAITRLCKSAISINKGKIDIIGDSLSVVRNYLHKREIINSSFTWTESHPGNSLVQLISIGLFQDNNAISTAEIDKEVIIQFNFRVLSESSDLVPGVNVHNDQGDHLFTSHDVQTAILQRNYLPGVYKSTVKIPGNFFSEGEIFVSVAMMSYSPFTIHFHETNKVSFLVVDKMKLNSSRGLFEGPLPGLIRPKLDWKLEKDNYV
jgi:lipopolysaccharide transport system ATP-binding protein